MEKHSQKFKVSFRLGWKLFGKRLASLFFEPAFLVLTVLGNSFVFSTGLLFYWLEKGQNPNLQNWLDGIWWSVATVTTVGYGDIVPVTSLGKILGIVLMLAGTALFVSFTALFARAIIGYEIFEVEEELKRLENKISKLKK